MDAAMILVLILSIGVLALMIWFEVNSRQNDAREGTKSDPAKSDPAKSDLETLTNEVQTKFVQDERKKAA